MDDDIPLVPISQNKKNRDHVIRQPTLSISYWKHGAVGNWELINAFFGFNANLAEDPWPPPDRLRDQFVANYLRTRPAVDQACPRMFRVTVCVALRNFILLNRDPLRSLEAKFDRQRLGGLRMMKNTRKIIHHGFGLLWSFCQTLQDQVFCQVEWLKNKEITPAECQDMIQIWEALRMLLEALWTRRVQRRILSGRKLLLEGRLEDRLRTADQAHHKFQRRKGLEFSTEFSFGPDKTATDEMKVWVEGIMRRGMYRIYEVLSEEGAVTDDAIVAETLREGPTVATKQGPTNSRPKGKLLVTACEDYMYEILCDSDNPTIDTPISKLAAY